MVRVRLVGTGLGMRKGNDFFLPGLEWEAPSPFGFCSGDDSTCLADI